MKKHLAYTMASLMALSAISAPAVSVYAQTETSTVETANETGTIQTAEEFLNLYCSYKNEIKDAQGNVVRTEYLRFTEIDEKNYKLASDLLDPLFKKYNVFSKTEITLLSIYFQSIKEEEK